MKKLDIVKTFLQNHKKAVIGTSIGAGVLVICVGICVGIYYGSSDENVVYKETKVAYGNLTVGITEDSTVSIGIVEQTFDLDISAMVSDDNSSSADSNTFNGMGGGMMMGWSSNYSSQEQEMEIESVAVTVGSNISAGDVLYTLNQQDVDDIRTQLEKDVVDTKADYEALLIEQEETLVQAKQGYDTYITNGELATVEYQVDIAELDDAIKEAEDNLQDAEDDLAENMEKLADYQTRLSKARSSLKEAEDGVADIHENILDEPYYYLIYENAREDASDLVDELENKIEELEDENAELVSQKQTRERELSAAQREKELKTLDARKTFDIDTYYQSVAGEWYDIQMTSLEAEVADAEYSYQSAEKKLEEFNTYIVGNDVVAEYDGVITDVPLEAGDTITMNTTLITLYDQSEVTMEVTLVEEDKDAVLDNQGIVISFTAYPDTLYEAVITDVGDATYDSDSGDLYYTLTLTLQGDVTGLYEGMTGDVTFITKETREVTYVSNRAIFRDGIRSYVKLRDEAGNIVEKDVTTGFSDGTNVEIVEGLSEGDTVLIESKVNES